MSCRIWQIVGFLNSVIAQYISRFVIAFVPIIVTIEQLINDSSHKRDVALQFIRVIEYIPIYPPINLTRIFLASLLYCMAALLYEAQCPKLLRLPKDKWMESAECAKAISEIKNNEPNKGDAQLKYEISELYDQKNIKTSIVSCIALLAILSSISVSFYVTAIVLWDNIYKVFHNCSLFVVLSFASSACK